MPTNVFSEVVPPLTTCTISVPVGVRLYSTRYPAAPATWFHATSTVAPRANAVTDGASGAPVHGPGGGPPTRRATSFENGPVMPVAVARTRRKYAPLGAAPTICVIVAGRFTEAISAAPLLVPACTVYPVAPGTEVQSIVTAPPFAVAVSTGAWAAASALKNATSPSAVTVKAVVFIHCICTVLLPSPAFRS